MSKFTSEIEELKLINYFELCANFFLNKPKRNTIVDVGCKGSVGVIY